MVEELFLAGAQVVQPRLAIRRRDEPAAGTFTVAGEPHVALPAILGQAVQFVEPERALLFLSSQFRHRRIQNIS